MGTVLVFTENNHGNLKRSSIELLQAAQKSGNKVVAIALGSHASEAASDAGKNGAAEVHIIKDSAFDTYNPEAYAASVSDVLAKVSPQFVLASATSIGKDLFPRIAAKLGAGIASDCIELTLGQDKMTAKKPLYSGKCFATAEFTNTQLGIVLMRPNQLPVAASAGASSASVVEHSATKSDLKTLIKEVVKGASEKLDLTEANIIVSGGRGLKDPANFKILNDLADVLGATVGASRAVVDAGWVAHDMQVGQTGKTVAPSLYIAVGISGAIQHLAGMSGSKVIVAINSDPNAPIFQKATYGIVGDALEVVPKLTEEFKKLLH